VASAATALLLAAAMVIEPTGGRPESVVDLVTTLLGWVGVVAAIGDAVRSRRAYVAAIEERAVRAEQTREEEARRQVAEERLRIARELHDVVAHHVAVVSVQAGAAAHLSRRGVRSGHGGRKRHTACVRHGYSHPDPVVARRAQQAARRAASAGTLALLPHDRAIHLPPSLSHRDRDGRSRWRGVGGSAGCSAVARS
jgi:hypothetical protein